MSRVIPYAPLFWHAILFLGVVIFIMIDPDYAFLLHGFACVIVNTLLLKDREVGNAYSRKCLFIMCYLQIAAAIAVLLINKNVHVFITPLYCLFYISTIISVVSALCLLSYYLNIDKLINPRH